MRQGLGFEPGLIHLFVAVGLAREVRSPTLTSTHVAVAPAGVSGSRPEVIMAEQDISYVNQPMRARTVELCYAALLSLLTTSASINSVSVS